MRKILLGMLIGVISGYACTKSADPVGSHEHWTIAQVRQQLDNRWQTGDTLPGLHQDLREFFPDPWKPFLNKEVSSAGIYEKAARWSEARCVYFQGGEGYVEIYLADYSADKQAFLRLIQKYEDVQNSPRKLQKIWPENKAGVFAWEWTDTQSELSYLEAGAYARYHIVLRTNLPESRRNLAKAWQKLKWEKLQTISPPT